VVEALAVVVAVDVVVQGGKGGGCLLLSWSCVFFCQEKRQNFYITYARNCR
jgi:hypothetical protein